MFDQKEYNRIRANNWRHKNPERQRLNQKEYRHEIRMQVLIHYGGNPPKCSCCGETHEEFLSIDHIKGNGRKHREDIRISNGLKGFGSMQFYRWLINNNFPEGFQVLCMNCNWAKGKYGLCPHKAIKVLSPITILENIEVVN